MTIKDLMNLLIKYDVNTEVIIAKDAEWNTLSPCYSLNDNLYYIPETTWYGNAYDHDELSEDELTDAKMCVVLSPVN